MEHDHPSFNLDEMERLEQESLEQERRLEQEGRHNEVEARCESEDW
jgi:hypothetical protein